MASTILTATVGTTGKMGFPKIRVPFLGGPIIRTLVLGGLYWGPPYVGNYQMSITAIVTVSEAMLRILTMHARFMAAGL